MSIEHSAASCDWCSKSLDNGVDVACIKCYEELEAENGHLKDKIANLEETIAGLESRLP